MHPAEALYVRRVETALAVGRSCKLCNFGVTRRKPYGLMAGMVGRGNGMREGNKQRGVLIQHIKSCHPAEYKAAMELKK